MENIISDKELVEAMAEELSSIERFRTEVLVDLIGVCRAMHAVRAKLSKEMIQILVEEDWKSGEVTGHLASACERLLKAVKVMERNKRDES